MKPKKITAIIVVFLCTAFQSYAQSAFANLTKYWWYRYRLVNDFMKVGDSAGESIPVMTRMSTTPDDPTEVPSLEKSWGNLNFGDATQHLGQYIMMLSAESRILESNGRPAQRTYHELYYALKAFDRLDKNFEDYCTHTDATYPDHPDGSYFLNTALEPLNGFFMRDSDAPMHYIDTTPYKNFIHTGNNYRHFNRSGVPFTVGNNTSAWTNRVWINGFIRPYEGQAWSSIKRRMPSEESQDQMFTLYLGTGLASRILSGNANYNGDDLKRHAGDIQYRMIRYAGTSYNNASGVSPWYRIINPVSKQCVYGTSPNNNCNAGGADASFNGLGAAFGLRRTAYLAGACNHAQIAVLEAIGGIALNQAWSLAQFAPLYVHDLIYPITSAAYANNWFAPAICWTTPSWLSPSVPYICTKNTTYINVFKMSYKNGGTTNGVRYTSGPLRYPHLPMAFNIVSGQGIGGGSFLIDPSPIIHETFPQVFNQSPRCGAYNYATANNPNDYGAYYWSTANWLGDAFKRGKLPSGDNKHNYSNLDYMSLFNLYNLNDRYYMNYFFNSYYKEKYNINYPYGNFGNAQNKLGLNFLEYLSLANKHYSGANVTYRGAKVVELIPGFDAQGGSTVVIYAQDFSCEDPYKYATNNGIEIEPSGLYDRVSGEADAILEAVDITSYVGPYEPNEDFNIDDIDTSLVVDTSNTDYLEAIQNYKDSLWNNIVSSGDTDLVNFILENEYYTPSSNKMGTVRNAHLSSTTNHAQMVNNVKVFPNPTTGLFTISFPNKFTGSINISSMEGKLVYSDRFNNIEKLAIDLLPKLSTGVYLLSIYNSSSHLLVHREKLIYR